MAIFNVAIGVLGGAFAMIPSLYVTSRWAKAGTLLVALLFAFICNGLSQQYIYPHYLLWRFENVIKTQPVFELIKKNHPKQYQDYLNTIKQSFKKSEDIGVVTGYTAQLLNRVFNEHLEKAPDDPIDLYLKSTLELYRYLYTKSPQAIVMMETGAHAETVDLKELSEDLTFETLLSRLLDTKKLIIEESIKSPVNQNPSQKAVQSLETIYDNLSKKFGSTIIRAVFIPSELPVPPRVSSLVIIEFYSEILATGKETAGDIMRYIGAKNYQAETKQ